MVKLIKNFHELAETNKRKIALKILEAGLTAIQPKNILAETLRREGNTVFFRKTKVNLDKFENVYLIGFGKGSAEVSALIEKEVSDRLVWGKVIDTIPMKFKKIEYTTGTHPLPSKINVDFTEKVLKATTNLTEKDLVIVVVCGGGSALFESPAKLGIKDLIKVSKQLINSGADIEEVNVVRKHLSKVKGGGLAKHLYPARVVNLIFSDVPGNDFSVIASGPTVKSITTIKKARKILSQYGIDDKLVPQDSLVDLPGEDKFFENVTNILMLSNLTALQAMSEEAKQMGYKSFIFSDRIQGDAKKLGKKLIEQTPPGKILLAGGETTVKVTGKGKGGRNQTLVLACLPVPDDTLILSFASDGLDYYYYGGALGDKETIKKSERQNLKPGDYLVNDDSYEFFKETGDGIFSGKLGSNVADLIMVLKI